MAQLWRVYQQGLHMPASVLIVIRDAKAVVTTQYSTDQRLTLSARQEIAGEQAVLAFMRTGTALGIDITEETNVNGRRVLVALPPPELSEAAQDNLIRQWMNTWEQSNG